MLKQVRELDRGDRVRVERGPFTFEGEVVGTWRIEGDGVTIPVHYGDGPTDTKRITFGGLDSEVEVLRPDKVDALVDDIEEMYSNWMQLHDRDPAEGYVYSILPADSKQVADELEAGEFDDVAEAIVYDLLEREKVDNRKDAEGLRAAGKFLQKHRQDIIDEINSNLD